MDNTTSSMLISKPKECPQSQKEWHNVPIKKVQKKTKPFLFLVKNDNSQTIYGKK